MSSVDHKPRGRDEVTEAIVAAAADLFAERGPAAVSLREVAACAGVNYGLVHRHIGTKDALVRRVVAQQASDLARALDAGMGSWSQARRVLAEHEAFWRVLAWSALEGADLADLQDAHPSVGRLLDRLEPGAGGGGDEHGIEARVTTAAAVAMLLGWVVLEEWLFSATGLEGCDPAVIDEHLDRIAARLANVER